MPYRMQYPARVEPPREPLISPEKLDWYRPISIPVLPIPQTRLGWFTEPLEQSLRIPEMTTWWVPTSEPVREPRRLVRTGYFDQPIDPLLYPDTTRAAWARDIERPPIRHFINRNLIPTLFRPVPPIVQGEAVCHAYLTHVDGASQGLAHVDGANTGLVNTNGASDIYNQGAGLVHTDGAVTGLASVDGATAHMVEIKEPTT